METKSLGITETRIAPNKICDNSVDSWHRIINVDAGHHAKARTHLKKLQDWMKFIIKRRKTNADITMNGSWMQGINMGKFRWRRILKATTERRYFFGILEVSVRFWTESQFKTYLFIKYLFIKWKRKLTVIFSRLVSNPKSTFPSNWWKLVRTFPFRELPVVGPSSILGHRTSKGLLQIGTLTFDVENLLNSKT